MIDDHVVTSRLNAGVLKQPPAIQALIREARDAGTLRITTRAIDYDALMLMAEIPDREPIPLVSIPESTLFGDSPRFYDRSSQAMSQDMSDTDSTLEQV